ncbi:ExeM/NucH family extracellular endonuclease [Modicisalibacter luteus]|uniref:ExeM/NucH family extracellular endonuclease n=2 Tax=Modicisalibacter luteus TaxID=453962 RepID=A0ABV7M3Y1_9GAMM|nr:ExeM/NucH family extracellular endonuclease [Halomonas lutea]GHA86197.1 extracelullar DNA degradation protein EddB [Halomonas lutea]
MLGNYANTAASASAFVNAANFKLNAISQAVKDILHHDTSWQSFDLRVAIADRLKDFPPSNEPEPGTEEPQGGLIISEYVEGSGYNKALELTNMSSEGLSLEGYQLSLYSNGSSQTSSSLELSDYGTLAAGETLVIANSQASADITARSDASSGVANFNGNDALVLSGPDGATLDVLGEVGNDVTYAQDVTLRRNADVTQGSASFDDGQWQTLEQDAVEGLGYAGDQTGSVDGGVGEGDTGSEPPAKMTAIHAIQGSGDSSPLAAQTVSVNAIVTMVAPGMDGFFLQQADDTIDENAQTSEGIFVYAGNNNDALLASLAAGDRVELSGEVSEHNGRTELDLTSDISIVERGLALPTSQRISLPYEDHQLEPFEGMRVTVDAEDGNGLTVTELYQLGQYGQVTLASGGRVMQYTEENAPSQEGYAEQQEALAERTIILDDASSASNPYPIQFGRDGNPLSADNPLRGGDSVEAVTGVLDFSYDEYRVQTTDSVDFDATNPREAEPDREELSAGGAPSLEVASFNVLNYFTTLDQNGNTFFTPGGVEHAPRGAENAEEFMRQQAKLVSAINGTDAEVVGLMELQNNGYDSDSAIASLVDALNAAADDDVTWAYATPRVDPQDADSAIAVPGDDAITVGIIYNSEAVDPVGAAATTTEGAFAYANRAPIMQTFRDQDTGGVFSVAVNHFKSKGSVVNGEEAAGDGQGNNNPTRVEAAEQLSDWIASDPTGSGDSDVLILGDLNSYAEEDPITALENDGYALLDDDYSYVFDGQWGSLDHALASESLNEQVTGTTTWHINADEATALDYNLWRENNAEAREALYAPTPYRSSDHDPVIVGLNPASDAASFM